MNSAEWLRGADLVASSWMAEGQRPSADAPPCPIPLQQRVVAAAHAGFVGIGLNRSDYESLLAMHGARCIGAILTDGAMRHVELETLQGWWLDDPKGDIWQNALDRMLELTAHAPVRQIKLNGDFGPTPPSLDTMRDGFARLAARAAQADTVIGIEPVAFSNIRDAATAKAVVADTAGRGGGVTLDCWHFARMGLAPDDLGGLSAKAIAGVEMSNVGADVVGSLFEDTLDHRHLPDDGVHDVPAYLRAVAASGYRGPIGCEVLSNTMRALPLEQALSAVAMSARAVLRTAAEACNA